MDSLSLSHRVQWGTQRPGRSRAKKKPTNTSLCVGGVECSGGEGLPQCGVINAGGRHCTRDISPTTALQRCAPAVNERLLSRLQGAYSRPRKGIGAKTSCNDGVGQHRGKVAPFTAPEPSIGLARISAHLLAPICPQLSRRALPIAPRGELFVQSCRHTCVYAGQDSVLLRRGVCCDPPLQRFCLRD